MPKTVNNLAAKIYDFDNIYEAFVEVSHKKQYKVAFQKYCLNIEEELITIQNELIWRTYRPSSTVSFFVREPKQRFITRPDLRDRIVHHALIRVVLPYFERHFNRASFACRKGRGQLSACMEWQRMIRSALGRYGTDFVVVSIDIKSYFASIDHVAIKYLLRRLFSDDLVLWLFDSIIDSVSDGLPIGFLPSQHEANLIGTVIDYFVTDLLGLPLYIRYMDDMRIICKDRLEAKEILAAIDGLCTGKLILTLSPKKTVIKPWRGKDTFCGYIVSPHHFEPKRATVERSENRLKKKLYLYKTTDLVSLQQMRDTTTSFIAYLSHTATPYNPIADFCARVTYLDKQKQESNGTVCSS